MIPQPWKWELMNSEILPQSHPWMRDAAPGKGGQMCQVLPRDVVQESSLNRLKPYSLWIMYPEKKRLKKDTKETLLGRESCLVTREDLLSQNGGQHRLWSHRDFAEGLSSEGRILRIFAGLR
uniref:Uncharacterized protein n=1 Tax=Meleagris gallopavo TaxID=9103 RepID=A0A803YPG9_MELGA